MDWAGRETPSEVDREQPVGQGWPVLRPGVSNYARLRRGNYAYVDKTGELAQLLDSGEFLFLARPRRFGKTLMLSTIECMYQGDLPRVRHPAGDLANPHPKVPDPDLFAGTAWEALFASQPRHPVVRLDMSTVTGSTVEEVGLRLRLQLAEQCLLWFGRGFDPCTAMEWLVDPRLYPYPPEQLMRDLLASLQQQDADPVVLVDEYDTPLLKLLGRDPAEVEPIFELFREFYRLFKQCEADLHKVLITGITRRAYGEMFSALNNLQDCTWEADCGAVCGFTDADLHRSPLAGCIALVAAEMDQSPDELCESLRINYNGYRFDPQGAGPAVYNPWSLCRTLTDLTISQRRERIQHLGFPAHWSDSGVSKSLVDALQRQPAAVDPMPFNDPDELEADFYSNRATGLKSLMLQSGYLTHHPARDGQPARLGWPNREVARTVLRDLARAHVNDELPGIERLRTCLELGDYTGLPKILLDCLYAFPYNIMDDEYSHHAALHGIFLGMGVVPRSERRELSGTYDLAAIYRGRACVFELKYNRSLREAQAQADRRQYGRSLLLELDRVEAAVCIALHVTKAGAGQVRIEGAQRPVHDIKAAWLPLGPVNH